jgi:hypothetical protein
MEEAFVTDVCRLELFTNAAPPDAKTIIARMNELKSVLAARPVKMAKKVSQLSMARQLVRHVDIRDTKPTIAHVTCSGGLVCLSA